MRNGSLFALFHFEANIFFKEPDPSHRVCVLLKREGTIVYRGLESHTWVLVSTRLTKHGVGGKCLLLVRKVE